NSGEKFLVGSRIGGSQTPKDQLKGKFLNIGPVQKKRLPLLIAGAGGKKSSGSSRTPVEADDTVNSRAMASILDLLGEG
ncbi:hypothetical protein ACHWI2_43375, partial [Klebsiella pneumoniae]